MGFSNISIDLIFGIPGSSDNTLKKNIEIISSFGIPHVSCYALTIEPKTALNFFVQKGKMEATKDEESASQFQLIQREMAICGYELYEISNYCQPGAESRHNTGYWRGEKYLGIGPSAHSFNGESRQWNIPNNAFYTKALNKGELLFETEVLTPEMKYQEYVLTSIRTKWGCDLERIRTMGLDFYHKICNQMLPLLKNGLLKLENEVLYLTEKGYFLSDYITRELF